jgi:hypothetical protein
MSDDDFADKLSELVTEALSKKFGILKTIGMLDVQKTLLINHILKTGETNVS